MSGRFTFFDQIHTTGIDIKQSPTARAVITIGKDMVFRDYAQGAYRMRGIGKGQSIHLYLVPEVVGLVSQTLQSCSAETGRFNCLKLMCLFVDFSLGKAELDVPAWLLLNSIHSEGMQYVKCSLIKKNFLIIRQVHQVMHSRNQQYLSQSCFPRTRIRCQIMWWSFFRRSSKPFLECVAARSNRRIQRTDRFSHTISGTRS